MLLIGFLLFSCNIMRSTAFKVDPLSSALFGRGRTATTTTTTAYMSAPTGKSGARLILTDQSFVEISSNKNLSDLPVLIFFTAPWCGPCRLSNPVVKDIAKDFAGQIDVREICTDDLPDSASDAGVV